MPHFIGKGRQFYMLYLTNLRYNEIHSIFIANKQNQVTARCNKNLQPEGWETKNLFILCGLTYSSIVVLNGIINYDVDSQNVYESETMRIAA